MAHAMDPHRCALRMVAHTLAMAATLSAPAALQAALLMRPGAFPPDQAAAAMSCVLAAAVVCFPALMKSLLAGAPGRARAGSE